MRKEPGHSIWTTNDVNLSNESKPWSDETMKVAKDLL
jgi:hypothetical protein